MDFDSDDFEFGGELPESDEEHHQEEEDYDKRNEDTFDAPLEQVPTDLSDFAAKALQLNIGDDDFQPNCSVSSNQIWGVPSWTQPHDQPASAVTHNIPLLPRENVLSAEELERRILAECNHKKTESLPTKDSAMMMPPNSPPVQQQLPDVSGVNQIPPGCMPNPMQMHAQNLQHLHRQMAMNPMMVPSVPPMMPPFNGPPPPPQYLAAMYQMYGMMPPPLAMQHWMQQMSNASNSSQTPTPVPPTPRSQTATPHSSQLNINPHIAQLYNLNSEQRTGGCLSPSDSANLRRTRKDGMPSKRTIADFACDPFAGFMSQKEREWLIKIQLAQANTQDKYTDDYYYTMWKKKNVLEKRPESESWKQSKIKSKYYNFEESHATSYIPPTFSGALGKPTHATTSYPRQCFKVLDIHPVDDDDESISSGSTRDGNKRKVRTILLAIENAYLLQLEYEDICRKISMVSPEQANELFVQMEAKLNGIYSITMDESHIPTTMLITKGRRLYIRVIEHATPSLKIQIIANVFNTLRKYSRKVSYVPNIDFIRTVLSSLVKMHVSDLKQLLHKIDAERFKDTLVYSSFSQNLFTTLLVSCAHQSLQLDHDVVDCSVIQFLHTERKKFTGLGSTFNEIFSADDLNTLFKWNGLNSLSAPGNVAESLLNCLAQFVV